MRLKFVKTFIKLIKITNCVCGCICNGCDVAVVRAPDFMLQILLLIYCAFVGLNNKQLTSLHERLTTILQFDCNIKYY